MRIKTELRFCSKGKLHFRLLKYVFSNLLLAIIPGELNN